MPAPASRILLIGRSATTTPVVPREVLPVLRVRQEPEVRVLPLLLIQALLEPELVERVLVGLERAERAEPAELELLALEPVGPELVVLEPVVLEPVVLEPVVLEPVVLEPVVLEPVVLEPASNWPYDEQQSCVARGKGCPSLAALFLCAAKELARTVRPMAHRPSRKMHQAIALPATFSLPFSRPLFMQKLGMGFVNEFVS